MPRGGWLHEVRRWACCGLWRTGGPSPGFGAFSSSPYTVPLCWVWGPRHRGIVELSIGGTTLCGLLVGSHPRTHALSSGVENVESTVPY